MTGSTIVTEVSALAFDPQNSAHLYAATRGEGMFYSPDGGATWSANNQGLTDLYLVAMAIQTASPYRVFAATYGGNGFWATVPAAPSKKPYAVTTIADAGGIMPVMSPPKGNFVPDAPPQWNTEPSPSHIPANTEEEWFGDSTAYSADAAIHIHRPAKAEGLLLTPFDPLAEQ
jgi:hypothetical protein